MTHSYDGRSSVGEFQLPFRVVDKRSHRTSLLHPTRRYRVNVLRKHGNGHDTSNGREVGELRRETFNMSERKGCQKYY